ncbi:MAG TPA: RecQ family ATP-dependent DNA helicase [Flavilitoribacter sp.]|nr:RecQ family ATP-dependent DNA helicase [Flavilitoribacter sp.]
MDALQEIIFFDLEANPRTDELLLIGAFRGGDQFVGKGIAEFAEFSRGAHILCGHNIISHDLPLLKSKGLPDDFLNRPSIDTLFWSALLFPRKPYHHLVKDYHLAGAELNNPLADAAIARALFADILAAFHSLPRALKLIYTKLLENQPGFNGLFEVLDRKDVPADFGIESLEPFYRENLSGSFCGSTSLQGIIEENPVELAFATALIQTGDPESVFPPWIFHRFPEVQGIIRKLRAECMGEGGCAYCRFAAPKSGLKRFFGYDQFRAFEEETGKPLQEQVVEAALSGKSLLAIFPTGGGKSLTFQLPALIRGEGLHALTVIISPLQSLMKDQVDVLRNRHDITSAVTINGMLSPLERADAIERVRSGGANLLYISPESLRSGTIFNLMKGRQIDRFVIDEAHCFSAWGQDFRVDYLYIGPFLKKLRAAKRLEAPIPVSCFTATAKPSVADDIRHYFKEKAGLDLELFQTGTARKNLTYSVIKTQSPEEKFERLTELLQSQEGPKIVYVARVKTSEKLAQRLREHGFTARAYNGQLDRDAKVEIQDAFMQEAGDTDIIVATTAFGMGVDKDNVSMVIHYNISDSLENYIQESGRAGRRPELRASCYILFDENDLNEHFLLLNSTKISHKEIYQIWQGIKRFKKKTFTKSALEIARLAGWDTEIFQLETRVKAAIAALEDSGYLTREENAARIFGQSILVKNVEDANSIIDRHSDLFSAEDNPAAKRVFSSMISRARTSEDAQVDWMADSLGLERDRVTHIINLFRQVKLLSNEKDLTAYYYTLKGSRHSKEIFDLTTRTEKALFELLFPNEEARSRKVFLREINETLNEAGVQSDILTLRNLLNYWQTLKYIEKERLDRSTEQFRIKRQVPQEKFAAQLRDRQEAAGYAMRVFQIHYLIEADKDPDFPDKRLMKFSVAHLKEAIEEFLPAKYPIDFYETVLLYLHYLNVIELKSGLLIYYNPMKITRQADDSRKQYTVNDYQKLGRYYQTRTEQIHIIGEYAKKQLQYHEEASRFVEDYFTLPYDDFLTKYFNNRKRKIQEPITEEKFQQIFGALSTEQLTVVKDNQSENVLVAAGPGSGKTRVLVHKVASLLLMEDVKPEQFLMLTFSRPAAQEFKTRLKALIGKLAYYIDIFTFHGFAFQLAGRVGNLERSQDILQKMKIAIEQEEISLERLRNKSVIVVDEYQDLSQEEYDFLMAIAGKSEKVRVIVVGDDDQNIYAFRGSSTRFMQAFAHQKNASTYFLTSNYRAKNNLVHFANAFLEQSRTKDRIKHGIQLTPYQSENGLIQVVTYKTGNLQLPLAESIRQLNPKGTSAVLTQTNEEALMVGNLLQQAGLRVRMIMDREEFPLRNMLEIRVFTHLIQDSVRDQIGLISEQAWQDAKTRIHAAFSGSANLKLAENVIREYERTNPRKLNSEWRQFLGESRIQDFYLPENGLILVSTMHKAKGKEFDNVFLMLNKFPIHDEEKERALYVAVTRAKNSLFIHTNRPFRPVSDLPGLHYLEDSSDWPEPDMLVLQCSLKDVWLDYFQQPDVARAVKNLLPGQILKQDQEITALFTDLSGERILWLSKKFAGRFERYLNMGYQLEEAKAQYVVIWHDEKTDKDFRVVLPELRLKKG